MTTPPQLRLHCSAFALVAALWIGLPVESKAQTESPIKPATAQQIADYRAKFAAYKAARERYEIEASAYWTSVTDKRRARNLRRRNGEPISAEHYVLTQPPVHTGPPRPIDPLAPTQPPSERAAIPVVADFLRNAQEQFQFMPRRPQSEIDFKRAYAKVASALGLTREQAVRVYSFEAGGNGKYDVQAGLEFSRPNARAISTALGYNQLLTTNTVELLAERGREIIEGLTAEMNRLPEPQRAQMSRKIAIVRKMIAFSKTVPDDWNAHEQLGRTPQGLGVHALNLDVDVGPWLQTYKLLISVEFAKRKGYQKPLSAAELEMMNLTGDGNGFDMVSMPPALRVQVPTSNFFQRGGYDRNPVAIRNNTVAKLIAATDARMDGESTKPGAKDLAAAF
jgi:hypothetical protein